VGKDSFVSSRVIASFTEGVNPLMVQEFVCGTDIEIELLIAEDIEEQGASLRIVNTFKQFSSLFSFTVVGLSSSLWS